jgi:uncharacterized repeat protein (TIGR02543 family)
VTFNTNGGNKIDPIEDVVFNSTIVLPSLPVKENYVFLGWEFNGEDFTSDTVVCDDITLNAIWTPYTEYKIFFDTFGGNIVGEQSVSTYAIITSLPVPEKTDYIFDGWLLNGQKIELPFLYDFGQDITLVARWKEIAEGIEYEIIGEKATINSYTGDATELIIPNTISGYPITAIKANAFKDNITLQKVVLGKYIINIGDYAFGNMISLKEVTLPTSATMLGKGILQGCNSLEIMTISGLMAYELRYLFGNNTNFIPNTLTKIKYAHGCTNIDKTMLSGNMKNVTTIELADDMTNIGINQFSELTFIKHIIIPDSVISIEQYAFNKCTSLTTIDFGKNVTNIGDYAFSGCSSLANAMIPDGVISIGEHAFSECIKIVNFVIPESVTNIGNYAFFGCYSLLNIVIPKSVTNMGYGAFAGSTIMVLVEALIDLNGWAMKWYDDALIVYGFLEIRENDLLKYAITAKNTVTILGLSSTTKAINIIIPDTIDGAEVDMIAYAAFANKVQIQSVTIPDTIRRIYCQTFYRCINLEYVYFGLNSQVETIEQFSFYESGLRNIVIPTSVRFIERNSFSYCTNLNSVYIPAQVQIVDNGAFSNCDQLTAYVEASSKPSGWGDYWIGYDRPVVWGFNW